MIGGKLSIFTARLRGLLDRRAQAGLALSLLSIIGFAANHSPTHAAQLSYEGMNYPVTFTVPNFLNGENGGSGWGNAWGPGAFNAGIVNNYFIDQTTLDSPLSSGESGNRARTSAQQAISGLVRNFDAGAVVPANANTTRYLSVLLRPEGQLNNGAFNGFFGVYLRGTVRDIFIGKPGGGALGTYVIEERGGGFQTLGTGTPAVLLNQTSLLVLRADLRNGPDSFRLVVNPTAPIGTTQPPLFLDMGAVTGIAVYSTGAHSVDEIRWGTTFESVVPEPSAWAMMATLAAVSASAAWRKRRGRERGI
jgi:hypothetical protein